MQEEAQSTAADVTARSTSGTEGTSDQAAERSTSRRTREQAAAGSRTLRSGAAIASPGMSRAA